MAVRTIEWRNGRVVMLDQRLLPTREVYRVYSDHREVARAIKDMVIRGAPAIGVAAAMGIALGARTPGGDFGRHFERLCRTFTATRPTAVNLFWAIERMRRVFARNRRRSPDTLRTLLEREALAIHDEDVAANRRLGAHGAALVEDGATVLTHCNAGALATAGYGTALGIVRAAVEAGKRLSVIACQTRPFLQGARPTARELKKDRIPGAAGAARVTAPLRAAQRRGGAAGGEPGPGRDPGRGGGPVRARGGRGAPAARARAGAPGLGPRAPACGARGALARAAPRAPALAS